MIKNMDELNKKFDGYQFRDQHGHDLLNCVDFIELAKDAETLNKARAVLAKWDIHVNDARNDVKRNGLFGRSGALVELADALEGGGDE